jgi:ribosomal protein L11 methyltransferase
VEAFDFDPDSVRVARANARLNGVARALRLSLRDLTREPRRSVQKFDVVCANLIHDLLIAEHARIIGRLRPGGTLVLAGILRAQFRAVAKVYRAAGLRLTASRREKEWQSGAFTHA